MRLFHLGHLAVGGVEFLGEDGFGQVAEAGLEHVGTVVGAVHRLLQLQVDVFSVLQLLSQQLLAPDVAALTEQTLLLEI